LLRYATAVNSIIMQRHGLHSLLLCTTKAWMNDYREPWTRKHTLAARRQELVHADAYHVVP
jgi:hypothetical protein